MCFQFISILGFNQISGFDYLLNGQLTDKVDAVFLLFPLLPLTTLCLPNHLLPLVPRTKPRTAVPYLRLLVL